MIRFHGWLIPVMVTVGGLADVTSRWASGDQEKMDDAAILSTLDRMNAGELECAGLALTHATSSDVRALAQRLRQDHSALRAQGREVAARLRIRITVRPGEVADSHAAMLADLKAMKGADFDRAFIEHEIGVHHASLHQVNRTMIPGATSAEVKGLLNETVSALQVYLDLAKAAKAAMKA